MAVKFPPVIEMSVVETPLPFQSPPDGYLIIKNRILIFRNENPI